MLNSLASSLLMVYSVCLAVARLPCFVFQLLLCAHSLLLKLSLPVPITPFHLCLSPLNKSYPSQFSNRIHPLPLQVGLRENIIYQGNNLFLLVIFEPKIGHQEFLFWKPALNLTLKVCLVFQTSQHSVLLHSAMTLEGLLKSVQFCIEGYYKCKTIQIGSRLNNPKSICLVYRLATLITDVI